MPAKDISRLYTLFAELLDYPTPALEQTTAECVAFLATACPQAAEVLAMFQESIAQEPPSRREEIYTNTFDLHSVCYPYIGHHLFGESYKRSWFMARLNQGYREQDFTYSTELPDHVAVILRFLASPHPTALGGCGQTDEFSQVLFSEGLVPAVEKMLQAFGEGSTNPYQYVLKALQLILPDSSVALIPTSADSEKGGLVNA